jgi:hypothetical protein
MVSGVLINLGSRAASVSNKLGGVSFQSCI